MLLPLWASCKRKLGPAAAVMEPALELCHAATFGNSDASSGGGAHKVQQFMRICPDGVRAPIAHLAPFVLLALFTASHGVFQRARSLRLRAPGAPGQH